jgi:hypothetical protein
MFPSALSGNMLLVFDNIVPLYIPRCFRAKKAALRFVEAIVGCVADNQFTIVIYMLAILH